MIHTLPELPYDKNALAPHISAETFDYHYSKHHQAYVTNLNNLIRGTKFETMSLEEIILSSEGGIFNNAAQVWNHTFFWHSLSPNGGSEPTGKIADLINKQWGSVATFKDEFQKMALGNFGSGWTWLVLNKENQLQIINTSNAETPLTKGLNPLLTIDVWEHAYYIDYRNARANFVAAYWNIVNWEFANKNL